jgi:hypothetical protein
MVLASSWALWPELARKRAAEELAAEEAKKSKV